MKPFVLLSLLAVVFLANSVNAGKKKKKAPAKGPSFSDDTKMFDSKTLKCLVCKNVIKEFEAAIFKIDPKKMIDTGTFRVNEKGEQKRSIVRSAPLFCCTNLKNCTFALRCRFRTRDRKCICSI